MAPWQDHFQKLVTKMSTRKDAEFFLEPVPWAAMGLMDYPKIITNPMDLSTVRSKLEAGKYKRPLDGISDVRLIFLNAMTYNRPGSKIYVHAKSLSEHFESSCRALVKDEEEDVNRPPTTEQMKLWVDKCHRISKDQLGQVLRLLSDTCPSCLFQRPETNEVDVNVDLLDGRSFREASLLVDSLLPAIPVIPNNHKVHSSNS